MNRFLTFVLLALAAAACPPKPPIPPEPPPVVEEDAGAEPGDEMTCAHACERLWRLGCKAGRPTPKGASCLSVCRNVMESGLVTWNLACLATAASCAAADRCR